MTQYDTEVERVRVREAAIAWATKVAGVHAHSIDSMWYDDRPQDTANGKSVTDTEYQNGTIIRTQGGKHLHTFGIEMNEEEMIDAYLRK
jgi:hypothetical protein